MLELNSIKALFFDVFGTLADWRGSIAKEAEAMLSPLGYRLDWFGFADAWRGEYQTGMEEVRSGKIEFCKLDVLHRRNLERILPRFGLEKLQDEQRHRLTLSWHKLDAWPGTRETLVELRKTYLIAPVSNGNISLQANLAKHNGFCWDAILGAEIAGDYKPKPRVYLAAAEAFDLSPDACIMVAAHSSDLAAAAACGLKTCHLASPLEFGPGGGGEAVPTVAVDIAAVDFNELVRLLRR
jgi:2-haloacid dehalogenase